MTNISRLMMHRTNKLSSLRPREVYTSFISDNMYSTLFLHLDSFSNLYTMTVDLTQKLQDDMYEND